MTPFNFKNLDNLGINIPDQWIYEYYLNLRQPLTGTTVRVKSPFNTEKTPSTYLYVKNGKYVWKDHSSGLHGDAINLVQLILEQAGGSRVTFSDTITAIKNDYALWLEKGNTTPEYLLESEFFAYNLVHQVERRNLDVHDLKFFGRFGIKQETLQLYNVIPLKRFRLGRYYQQNTQTKWYNWVQEYHSYGFYKSDGTLYKIYNPYSKDLKHITLEPHLIGRDQLQGHKTLIIGASMKDILTIYDLDLEVDLAAPPSESSIIHVDIINDLKEIYPNIVTLFDNDRTGVKSMLTYKALYNIDFAYIPYEKDISEFRENAAAITVKHAVTRAINTKIFKGIINGNQHNKETSKEEEKARERAENYQGGLFDS